MPCARPILLVEDNPVDALAIRRALRDLDEVDPVVHASCAQEALARLRTPETDRPALILLDLNLPGTDGLQFLQIVKDDPSLRDIPIVVLTASDQPRDILRGFDLGIAGYMVKAPGYEGLLQTVRIIQSYWKLSQSPWHHAGCGICISR